MALIVVPPSKPYINWLNNKQGCADSHQELYSQVLLLQPMKNNDAAYCNMVRVDLGISTHTQLSYHRMHRANFTLNSLFWEQPQNRAPAWDCIQPRIKWAKKAVVWGGLGKVRDQGKFYHMLFSWLATQQALRSNTSTRLITSIT